ncbi:MAG TPA: tripartite tricarboxylate transporter TctB family protein [Devosia sp.]|nr:tripartite tricarboxylate transporter TctB family protein [Devosia sp.]
MQNSTSMPALTVPRLYLGILTALLLVGVLLIHQGMALQYYGRFGPGAGFFPVWIGILLSGVVGIAFVQTLRELRTDTTPALAADASLWRVLAMIGSLVAIWLLIGVIGFRLSVLLYMLFVPLLIARLPLIVLIPTALAASFGASYIFESWLLVRLPAAQVPFLAGLGL